jgi:hypothetical protein
VLTRAPDPARAAGSSTVRWARTERSSRVALVMALALAPVADGAVPAQTVCIESRGEARFRGLGYDHLVILTNRCDPTYTCAISTDVSPDIVVADAPGRAQVEVLTFRGSPASQFTHRADCRLK